MGSTIYYVTALDGGDPNVKIDFRDEIFTLDAPFKGVSPHSLTKLDLRYAGVVWGNDQTALVSARRWKERRLTTWRLNPSKKNSTKIMDRSYEDRYNDPGSPMMEFNLFGRSVMALFEGSKVLMSGTGASPKGDMPFVDIYDLQTKMSTRLWRCEAPYYERAISIINKNQKTIITSRESKDETTNYMIRGLNDGALNPITDFAHPYPQMKNLYKEMVTYKRSDGIDLSATLYLPPGRGESSIEEGGGVVLVKDVIKNESLISQGEHEGKKAGRLLPLFRGANTDLNTTLAIAIVAMFFVTYWGISELGIKKYGSKFINFSSPIMLFVGILELIAEFARVVSFTFRLFGNMFAGEVLLIAMMFLLPFIGIVPFMGLELFVGVIQAFIFSMLTLIFGVTAIADHSEH